MSGHSPIDSLRRLAPVSDADAAALFGTAGREELLAEVTRLPFGRGAEPRRVAPRRRRLVLALAAVAVVAVATAATWVVLSNGPARETTSVECVIKGVDTIIPSTSGDPAQDCAVEWKRELGQAAPRSSPTTTATAGSRSSCAGDAAGGLQAARSGQDADLIQLQNSLDDSSRARLELSRTTPPRRRSRVEARRFGFTGWKSPADGASQPPGVRTCIGSAYVDPVARTVNLSGYGVPSGAPERPAQLADKLRPIARQCQSLPAAVAAVRNAANSLGLSESAKTYELNAVTDNSMRCASIYETVGGTIFLTVRGPGR